MSNQRAIPGFVPSTEDETFAFLDVDYDEGKPETYRGVHVNISRGTNLIEEKTFTLVRDAIHFASTADRVAYSSSFDHFDSDGGVFPEVQ